MLSFGYRLRISATKNARKGAIFRVTIDFSPDERRIVNCSQFTTVKRESSNRERATQRHCRMSTRLFVCVLVVMACSILHLVSFILAARFISPSRGRFVCLRTLGWVSVELRVICFSSVNQIRRLCCVFRPSYRTHTFWYLV